MSYATQAAEAVRLAEKAVAHLVGSASAAQDWDEAGKLIGLGRQLRNLADEMTQPVPASREVPLPPSGDIQVPSLSSRPSTATKKVAYPLFFRESDTLVKVAWSKSQRKEYEHKSPRKVLDLIVPAMLKVGPKGKRFSMDHLLPVQDVDTGSKIPEYQSYVVFAWLKSLGFVEQHGRGGYSITDATSLSEAPVRCWERLAVR